MNKNVRELLRGFLWAAAAFGICDFVAYELLPWLGLSDGDPLPTYIKVAVGILLFPVFEKLAVRGTATVSDTTCSGCGGSLVHGCTVTANGNIICSSCGQLTAFNLKKEEAEDENRHE